MSRARTGSFKPEHRAGRPTIAFACRFTFRSASRRRRPVERAAWETRAARQRRRICPGDFAGAVRLPAQEPLARIRRIDQRRRRFGRRVVPGGDAGAASAWRTGPRGFLGQARLLRRHSSSAATNEKSFGRLLACVYQSTRNSGDVTRNAARGVAEAIGAEFLEFDVDALVQDYVGIVSKAIGRELRWETDDIALQNIQARVRSPGVWMLANLRGALLASTSNRSEAAVGYATMDGDTSGGLSPIAGIDKAFLAPLAALAGNHRPARARAHSRAAAP